MTELEQIVRRLALSDPWFWDETDERPVCRLCEAMPTTGRGEPPAAHTDDCPWVRARLWVATHPT